MFVLFLFSFLLIMERIVFKRFSALLAGTGFREEIS